jgi:hypothetical protein
MLTLQWPLSATSLHTLQMRSLGVVRARCPIAAYR